MYHSNLKAYKQGRNFTSVWPLCPTNNCTSSATMTFGPLTLLKSRSCFKSMGLDMSHNYLCEHKNNLCVNMSFVNVKHHPQMHLKDLQTHK